MSYNRHGGRRRHYRDDYDDRIGREVYETPEQRLKTSIIKFGDVDAEQELPKLANDIREQNSSNPCVPAIAEALRYGVTEEPYKIPYYAALVRALDGQPGSPSDALLGKQVLDDYYKGFQGYLDKLAWREVKLCVHFFAHLTRARVVSANSLLLLLQQFRAVLEEFGVSHSRAKNAALCVAEGLMIVGSELKDQFAFDITTLITDIKNYADSSSETKLLVAPIVRLHSESTNFEDASELLDNAVGVLSALEKAGFADSETGTLQPYSSYSTDFTPYFDLPSATVPPEAMELEALSSGAEESASSLKQEEWPEYRLRLFPDDITADDTTVLGYMVRTLLSDVVDIFEVNRKECSRLLLELPKWLPQGTFKARSGSADENVDVKGPQWQLESCIMEIILAKMLVLPKPVHKSVYYVALITELCKLAPQTTGPAVGKSIRRLYTFLADGLDVEVAARFTEWFATHMSNFGFQWVWKEWLPDLSLSKRHPKRNFIRRAIEVEIRLAYFDRVQKTLPAPFQTPEADALPEQAPGSEFDYDDPMNPYHDAAQTLLNLLRGRAKADDIVAHLQVMRSSITENTTHIPTTNIDTVIRSISMQSLLHIGSRSFSHFLNAIERYLPVLRSLAQTVEGKADLLAAAAMFWRRNSQMVRIVFDKLMQYQIVDPSDVIGWAFAPPSKNSAGSEEATAAGVYIDAFKWGIIEAALDKANGRVMIARKKAAALRKEEDDKQAREKASVGMEVDAEAVLEKPDEESPALTNARKAHETLTREQRSVLAKTLNAFVDALRPSASSTNTSASSTNTSTGTGTGTDGNKAAKTNILTEASWFNRVNWGNEDWEVWETWGWYRHFCRLYAPYLRDNSTTLGTIAFEKIADATDETSVLLKRVFNVSTGQEA